MSISNKICQLCGTFENLSLCAGCRSAWYCSHEHQKTDWKVHKLSCKKALSKKAEQQPGGENASCKKSPDVDEGGGEASSNKNNSSSTKETKVRGDNRSKEESPSCEKTTEKKSGRPASSSSSSSSSKGRGDKNKKSQTTGSAVVSQSVSTPSSTKAKTTTVVATAEKSVVQPPPVVPPVKEGTGMANERRQNQHGKRSGSHKKKKNKSHSQKNDNDTSTTTTTTGDRENANSGGTSSSTNNSNSNNAPPSPEVRDAPRVELDQALTERIQELHHYVVECMDKYGICLVDHFLGDEQGLKILNEVKGFYDSGVFSQGQLVNSTTNTDGTANMATIRSDMIMWVDGNEERCYNIKLLMECVDRLVLLCKGKLGSYNINGRTKGMVACYPGNDTKYLRHIDNPNADGRCMTCIYYINKDWNVDADGGLLRIFPEGQETVANIVPQFDRLIFFWSDRRNPHEVQASKRCRYAITVWYFDAVERAAAMKRLSGSNNNGSSKPEDLTSRTKKP